MGLRLPPGPGQAVGPYVNSCLAPQEPSQGWVRGFKNKDFDLCLQVFSYLKKSNTYLYASLSVGGWTPIFLISETQTAQLLGWVGHSCGRSCGERGGLFAREDVCRVR